MKILIALVGTFIVMPIWYYLMFTVLKATEANSLTWFLFWIYIPFGLFVSIGTKLLENEE